MSTLSYRRATAADAPAVARIYGHYVRDTTASFETEAPDETEMANRIERIGAVFPWLLAECDGEIAGYAYACEHRARHAYRWSVDVAVYLDATTHRRGIGRGLCEKLLGLLREQGYVNAYAGITLPNAPSIGLHQALGFSLIGVYRAVGYKLGSWRDVGWWQLVLHEPMPNPEEPIPFPALDEETVAKVLDAR